MTSVDSRLLSEESPKTGEPAQASEERFRESALRDSEERYRLLFDATPLPVFVFDADTLQYLAVNEAALL